MLISVSLHSYKMIEDEEEEEWEDGKGAVQPWPSPSQYHEGLSATLSLCNTWTNHMAVTTGDEQSRGYWLTPKTLLSNPCFHSSIPLSPPPSSEALRRQCLSHREKTWLARIHPRQSAIELLGLTWCKIICNKLSRFVSFFKKMWCCLPVQNSLPLCQAIVSGGQGVTMQLLRF